MRFSDRALTGKTSLAALEMILTDKTDLSRAAGTRSQWNQFCLPKSFWTDNGGEFIERDFRVALTDLHIETDVPPPAEAEMRPHIESFLKTCSGFLSWYEGRTFSDYLKKGDYDSEGNASVCVDELNMDFVRAIVDEYHNTPHSALAGETPAHAWRRLSVEYKLLPLPSPRRRRQIFGLQVFRPITDKGITVLGLTYQSAELQKLRLHGPNVEFEVRFDRFDIWAISVKTGANSWLEVENRFGVPRGVSIWEWTGAARELLTVHARNAETDIDIVMEAINRRRNSGEALAARAEMGTDYASPKHIALLEKKVFMNLNLSEKDQGRSKQLAAMVSPEHPLAHGLDLLNDDLLDADTPPVGKQPDENAATTDQSGSGDYVEFD